MPAVDLRELVRMPINLTGSFATPSNPHPIHAGINQSHKYPSPSASPILLPRGGRGLHRLKMLIHEPVAGMDAAPSLEAHVKLLVEALNVHTEAGRELTGPEGETLDTQLAARTRSVLLAAVFRHSDEQFTDRVFSAPRFGAVGTLTVIPDATDPRLLEDAWLQVEWVHSSAAMLKALSRVRGLTPDIVRVSRRIEILVAEDLVLQSPDLPDDISRVATMLGASPRTHVLTARERGVIAAKVRANNPFELIVLGSAADEVIVSEFSSRHGDRNLHRASVSSADRAMEWLLDHLPRIMGVGPGLMGQPEVEATPGRPRMPVSRPVRCLHHGPNRYVLDQQSGEWWTRDFAKHGSAEQCIFKTYAMVSGELLWRSDRDAAGDIIAQKHKGPIGSKIYERETGSCGYPESHLH